MPLPSGPLTIHGGCNCRAVRYKIEIPPFSERILHPSITADDPKSQDPKACRIPFTVWDHCNDCRAATGALIPAWLCTTATNLTVSCVVADHDDDKQDSGTPALLEANAADRQYVGAAGTTVSAVVPGGKFPLSRTEASETSAVITRPGLEVFAPPFTGLDGSKKTWLRYYHSSPSVTRSFCGRCGTSLIYHVTIMAEGWPQMLDVVLGTIDREDLERMSEGDETKSERTGNAQADGSLQPERQMWWDYGIPWLRESLWDLEGAKHKTYEAHEEVERTR